MTILRSDRAQASSCSTCFSTMPCSEAVSTSSVGAGWRRAHSRQLSSMRSSIHANGRDPAYSRHCVGLPMGRSGGHASVEVQYRKVARELQQEGQILVCGLLPAGRPDELEFLRQPAQKGPGCSGYVVDDPVDVVQGSGRPLLEWSIPWRKPVALWEAEQTDNSVHINEKDGFVTTSVIQRTLTWESICLTRVSPPDAGPGHSANYVAPVQETITLKVEGVEPDK